MLEKIKEYLRIEHNEEDMLISSLISSGKEYLKNAGIKEENNLESELYFLAIALYVSNFYENRTLETNGVNLKKISFSLDSIILQLQLSQPSEVI